MERNVENVWLRKGATAPARNYFLCYLWMDINFTHSGQRKNLLLRWASGMFHVDAFFFLQISIAKGCFGRFDSFLAHIFQSIEYGNNEKSIMSGKLKQIQHVKQEKRGKHKENRWLFQFLGAFQERGQQGLLGTWNRHLQTVFKHWWVKT